LFSLPNRMIRKVFASVILILFIAISFNKVGNLHTHFVNGISIQHAHPFNHASKSHHSHSKSQILSIFLLNGTFIEDHQILELPLIIMEDYQLSNFCQSDYILSPDIHLSNKSPPYFSSSII